MTHLLRPTLLLMATSLLVACPTGGGRRATPEPEGLPRATLQIGLQLISVEVAETPEQKSRGLSGRPTLAQGHGMWFPYQTPAMISFWMRDMHFPLDFVWVRDGTIVDMAEGISPAGGTATMVRPGKPADAVLEIPAGTIARWGWRVGDAVVIGPSAD